MTTGAGRPSPEFAASRTPPGPELSLLFRPYFSFVKCYCPTWFPPCVMSIYRVRARRYVIHRQSPSTLRTRPRQVALVKPLRENHRLEMIGPPWPEHLNQVISVFC